LAVSEADRANIRAAVTAGTMRLAWITVSDYDAEDGDWVTISAGGFKQDVRLFNKPTSVAVPYVPGMPARVTGLIDGQCCHGITVGVHLAGNVSTLPLRQGQSIEVPTP
jgi:hypothetical protein